MTGDAAPALDNPLWRFACTLYAAPGVAAACLRLQDGGGCDVNMLLFAAWLGAERRAVLTEADMIAAPGQDWHGAVITPLRAARRAARAAPGIYAKLKQLELEAEQWRLALLFAWADGRFPCVAGAAAPIEVNLQCLLGCTEAAAELARAARGIAGQD